MLVEIEVFLKKITNETLKNKLTSILQDINLTDLQAQMFDILETVSQFSVVADQKDQEVIQNLVSALTELSFSAIEIPIDQSSELFSSVEIACEEGKLEVALKRLHATLDAGQMEEQYFYLINHSLGHLYALKKAWHMAAHYFNQALDLQEDIATYADYAWSALHNGQAELAKQLFAIAADCPQAFDMTEVPLVYYWLLDGDCFAEKDYLRIEIEQAKRLLIHPLPFVCLQLIQLQCESEKYLGILQAWVDQYLALSETPSETPLADMYCRILGHAYELNGNEGQAQKYFSRAVDALPSLENITWAEALLDQGLSGVQMLDVSQMANQSPSLQFQLPPSFEPKPSPLPGQSEVVINNESSFWQKTPALDEEDPELAAAIAASLQR
jgi:tetratricopeptide (TPR) repeat protein